MSRCLQHSHSLRAGLVFTCLLAGALSACSGSTGPAGPAGPSGGDGSAGPSGPSGVSTGTITGTLTWQPSSSVSPLPASAITITDVSITDSVVSVTSGADGTFMLPSVPAGVHSLTFTGNGYAALQVDGVSVLATRTAVVNRMLTATNPIVIVPAAAAAPVGFGAPATLAVTVSGGTAPYVYKWVVSSANPTAVALSSTTDPSPSFTTASLAAILASGKAVGFGQVTGFDTSGALAYTPAPQVGFLGISTQQLAQMTYNFTVTVTDAKGFLKSATVAVPPATLAQGNGVVPIGEIVIANIPGNSATAALGLPSGSTAVLHDAATPNPWFIPDAKGNYSITAGGVSLAAGPIALEVNASAFTSANPNCTTCHSMLSPYRRDGVDAKFKDWANSAHGNHFFKQMHYDNSGLLVWNTDARGAPVPAATANPTVNWSSPGAMTTFEFGMTGAEGTHYSGSCMGCHTTGYNALAGNGGFDDTAKAASWTFPNLSNMFTLVGATSMQTVVNGTLVTTTYDQVTAAPNLTAWNAIPSNVKAFAGMQCESCHGPLGGHPSFKLDGSTVVKPVAEYAVDACAVCHDRPTNHDRVALWRQSRHANMDVALAEGAGVSSTGAPAPRASCNRCHSAQGFVQYLNQLTGNLRKPDGTPIPGPFPGNLIDPGSATLADASVAYMQGLGITPDRVQPQTCQACHDPHTTALRVEGDTPMLPSGFQVAGAGSGAICFVCHNSRNGARGDQFNGIYTNNSNPGTPVSVTSIGAPHEAAQGDVVAGRNGFFVPIYNPSPHLAVKDACVGCHMKNFPAGVTGTNTNHTWKIDSTSCASCHGGAKDPVDGEALQRQFDLAAGDVAIALNTIGQAAVRGTYYKGSSATVQLPGDTTAVFVTGRSPGFVLTFSSPIADPNGTGTISSLGSLASAAGLGNFYTTAGATTKVFDVLKGTFAKANWNYELLAVDGSRGVHNPSFTFNVLSGTVNALNNSSLPK